ncbi:MAG: shikimate dehydrogenase [Saprospiraceae bacterium]|nr:shikimate dehydrogenase [Saprospiraceae bacterium]
MRIFGLIGWPLGHSFSKRYFSEKFDREGISDAHYALFPLEKITELPVLLASQPDLYGLNVTIPYKETVIPFLDRLDETARSVGAVNCIKIEKDRTLTGYNTDVIGFEQSLLHFEQGRWLEPEVSAWVLGSGGAAKAVAYVLRKYGVSFRFVSRRPSGIEVVSYAEMAQHLPSPATMIVNATPLGTFPAVDERPPVPTEAIRAGMFVYDLIYNPAETLLLRETREKGGLVKNGLEMLHLQAEAAWKIFSNDSAGV